MPETQTEPNDRFDEGLETGYELGRDEFQEEIQEQVYDQLIDAGFEEDEVEQALYDPDPRRRRRHRRSRTMYDPSPRRRKRYDPAPRRRRARKVTARRGGRKASAMRGLKKFEKWVFPAVAGGTFLMNYAARADALKALNLIPTGGWGGIPAAIQYDLTHFDAGAAMTRITSNIAPIAGTIVGGYAVKSLVKNPLAKLAGDALMGYGVGYGVKKLLDPPPGQPARQMTTTTQAQPALPQNSGYVAWGY